MLLLYEAGYCVSKKIEYGDRVGVRLALREFGGSGTFWPSQRSEALVAHQVGVEVVLVIRPQSKFDQGARIGDNFALPSLVSLEATHRVAGSDVPDACRASVKIVFADQGFLNLASTIAGDVLLPSAFPVSYFAKMTESGIAVGRSLPETGFLGCAKKRHGGEYHRQKTNSEFFEPIGPHKLLFENGDTLSAFNSGISY